MSFSRPSLATLVARIEADVVSRLQRTSIVLRRAFVRIIARVLAGAANGLHGHIVWASKQILASTADAEYLDLHGAEFGITRKVATFASGNVTFTGTDASVIASGTRLLRSDNVEYETTAAGVIASGSVTVAAIALASGADSNADAGTTLQLSTSIAGVAGTATVAAGGIANGVDAESDDDYLARILDRKRNPPQGGSEADYKAWALEVSGVTRVWVYGNYLASGQVGITFVLDDASPIIPDSTKVAEVQSYIADPSRKPITAAIEVFAPTAVPLDLTLSVVPDTTEVRDAVTAELQDLLVQEGEPDSTLLLTHINEAISSAAGETDHTLTSPAADIVYSKTEIPVLGTITWT